SRGPVHNVVRRVPAAVQEEPSGAHVQGVEPPGMVWFRALSHAALVELGSLRIPLAPPIAAAHCCRKCRCKNRCRPVKAHTRAKDKGKVENQPAAQRVRSYCEPAARVSQGLGGRVTLWR